MLLEYRLNNNSDVRERESNLTWMDAISWGGSERVTEERQTSYRYLAISALGSGYSRLLLHKNHL